MMHWPNNGNYVEVVTDAAMPFFVHFGRVMAERGVRPSELDPDSALTDVLEIVASLQSNEILVVEWQGPGVCFDLRFEAGATPWRMLEFDPAEVETGAMEPLLEQLAVVLGRPVSVRSEDGTALGSIAPRYSR